MEGGEHVWHGLHPDLGVMDRGESGELRDRGGQEEIVEYSSGERYGRYNVKLGKGAFKTVYKGYDTDEGFEIAWNQVNIGPLPPSEKKRIISEVRILEKVQHENIIKFFGSWYDKPKATVVFITEIVTAGTLKSFMQKVKRARLRIIRKW